MSVTTLGRSLPASALRRWRRLRFRTRATLALLAIGLLVFVGIILWNSGDGWPARAVLQTPGDTWPLAFSPDGKTFVTSGEGGITRWDVADGRKRDLWAIDGNRGAGMGAFSPDGRTFAAVVVSHRQAIAIDGIDLIDAASGRSRASLSTRFPSIYALRFADDGRTLRALLGNGPDLKEEVTWDVESGQEKSTRPLSAPTKGGITTISADGRILAIGPMNQMVVELWDLDADKSLGSVKNPKSTSNVTWGGVGLTSDGRTLAVARVDGTLELWDVPTRSLRLILPAHSAGYTSSGLRFSPDGRTLASTEHFRETSAIGEIQEGLWRAIGGRRQDHSEVIVRDLATGKRLARAANAIHPYYSPDGRTIATREQDLSVKLRDVPVPPR
jgi:WD40 repeat protein